MKEAVSGSLWEAKKSGVLDILCGPVYSLATDMVHIMLCLLALVTTV